MIKNTLAIVGTQWGDEGKGKITDFFSESADVVVRWAGGDNAGHTIKFNNQKFILTITPSGIFHKNKICVISGACAINLKKLVLELTGLKKSGINYDKLRISKRAHLILPYHIMQDIAEEEYRGSKAIGTTKKGIGPCYADRIKRNGIQINDLFYPDIFKDKLKNIVKFKNELFTKIYHKDPFDVDKIYEEYLGYFRQISHLICDSSILVNNFIDKKSKVLFEGAQGVMLDIGHGTYPFVTSSHPSAAAIPIDVGVAPQKINNILGIVKAYNSRVGNGIFLSEINNKISNYIRKRGHEYGSNTKRPRRVGWLDIVALKHACRISGVNGIAITLLDVLSGIKTLKLCVGYDLKGQKIDYIPGNFYECFQCKPIFIEMPGWQEEITGVKSFEELPINAQNYLNKISQLINIKLKLFSIGPDRTQTVIIDQELETNWRKQEK